MTPLRAWPAPRKPREAGDDCGLEVERGDAGQTRSGPYRCYGEADGGWAGADALAVSAGPAGGRVRGPDTPLAGVTGKAGALRGGGRGLPGAGAFALAQSPPAAWNLTLHHQ